MRMESFKNIDINIRFMLESPRIYMVDVYKKSKGDML